MLQMSFPSFDFGSAVTQIVNTDTTQLIVSSFDEIWYYDFF